MIVFNQIWLKYILHHTSTYFISWIVTNLMSVDLLSLIKIFCSGVQWWLLGNCEVFVFVLTVTWTMITNDLHLKNIFFQVQHMNRKCKTAYGTASHFAKMRKHGMNFFFVISFISYKKFQYKYFMFLFSKITFEWFYSHMSLFMCN